MKAFTENKNNSADIPGHATWLPPGKRLNLIGSTSIPLTAAAAILSLGLAGCASQTTEDSALTGEPTEEVSVQTKVAESADEATSADDAPALEGWTSFDHSTGHIRIPVQVAGVDGYALIDSGAKVNAISERFDGHGKFKLAKIKSSEAMIEGVSGIVKKPVYNRVPVDIGGNRSVMNQLVSVPLGAEENLLLLGMPLFERAIVQIDYPNQRIRFLDKSSVSLSEPANVKSSIDEGALFLNMAFGDNEPVWLTADTGASLGVLLGNKLVEDQQLAAGQPLMLTSGSDIYGVQSYKMFASNNVKIGPFVLDDVQSMTPEDPSKDRFFQSWHHTEESGRVQSQGLIGYDVFKHFLVTIDLSTNYVRLDLPDQS